jgi:XTP/dITP diphosphohydrolase
MKKILVASNNAGKLRELLPILSPLPVEVLTPRDVGLTLDVEETGATYRENAELKAVAFARASGLLTLADDSGLEVEALGGAPGVYSARYAGEGATDADRRKKLVEAARPFPAPRAAHFRCVIAIALSPAEVHFFEGRCAGEIVLEERGAGGFGYDPIFFMPERGATMAELPEAVKNQISHRARAAQTAFPFLQNLLAD